MVAEETPKIPPKQLSSSVSQTVLAGVRRLQERYVHALEQEEDGEEEVEIKVPKKKPSTFVPQLTTYASRASATNDNQTVRIIFARAEATSQVSAFEALNQAK